MEHPGGYGAARWQHLAVYVGWPRRCLAELTHIMTGESGGNPRDYNASSGATGLLQILASHVRCPARLFDPEYNLWEGLRLYDESGWNPWAQTR